MASKAERLSFLLAFIFTLTLAAVFLFIASGMVPYWQKLSGAELQSWFAGPFTRFAYMMIVVHLMSIGTMIWAFALHRRAEQSIKKLWYIAFVTLVIWQAFNFTLFGVNYNLALQSGTLDPDVALQTMDSRVFFHKVRKASVYVSVVALALIFLRSTTDATVRAESSD